MSAQPTTNSTPELITHSSTRSKSQKNTSKSSPLLCIPNKTSSMDHLRQVVVQYLHRNNFRPTRPKDITIPFNPSIKSRFGELRELFLAKREAERANYSGASKIILNCSSIYRNYWTAAYWLEHHFAALVSCRIGPLCCQNLAGFGLGVPRSLRTSQFVAAAEVLVAHWITRKQRERERPDIRTSESEGYVYHCYGDDAYLRHTVASVVTLRRYDRHRPIALYCPARHQALLQQHGLDFLFHVRGCLPDEDCSIVGFKHNLHKYQAIRQMPLPQFGHDLVSKP